MKNRIEIIAGHATN